MASNAPSAAASLDEWLRWQETLHPQAIALGLDRVRPVAARLGLPRRGATTITVGGTNGKGSTTALLAEIYRAAGRRVGMYQSPHLLRYNERIAIDGRPAADTELTSAFVAVEDARGAAPLTYFEYGTLAALWLFARANVDLQVLEVGLGGRLDAVNLVDADAAIITSIGLDHVDLLGATREAIALEKAGIFRPQQPAICADPDPPAAIGRHAEAIGARLWQLDREFTARRAGDAWHWQGPGKRYKKLPPPALPGSAQFRNAAAAIAAVERLQSLHPVPEQAIRAGLVRMRLPGRFERRALPGRTAPVILDVAHNVEAARSVADNLRDANLGAAHFVMGMLSDKPAADFAAVLAPLARRFYTGALPPPRGLAAEAMAAAVRKAAPGRVTACATVSEAFGTAVAEADAREPIVVCGSFLTVAAVTRRIDG